MLSSNKKFRYCLCVDKMYPKNVSQLFSRESLIILICDSGLGGLSVCAGIEENLKKYPICEKAKIIYYNAQPADNVGYNKMQCSEEKIKVLNNALFGMLQFTPDIIFIACNTLSVIYHETDFSRKTTIPVIGIVEFGVEMLYNRLTVDAFSSAIVFGTLTTIASGSHKRLLIQKGIDPNRIVEQACPNLQVEIEKGACSTTVKEMIAASSSEAISKITSKENAVYCALCCTHYGYSLSVFESSLRTFSSGTVEVLNPNNSMSGFLFEHSKGRYTQCYSTVEMHTQAVPTPEQIKAVSALLTIQSQKTVLSLRNFVHHHDLFDYKSVLSSVRKKTK